MRLLHTLLQTCEYSVLEGHIDHKTEGYSDRELRISLIPGDCRWHLFGPARDEWKHAVAKHVYSMSNCLMGHTLHTLPHTNVVLAFDVYIQNSLVVLAIYCVEHFLLRYTLGLEVCYECRDIGVLDV